MSTLVCGTCEQPIAPGSNYVDEQPPLHIHCAHVGSVSQPEPVRAAGPIVRMLQQRGFHSTCSPREPATVHAERPATNAYWDLPGHLPYVVVAQTVCPGPDPEQGHWVRGRSYMCRDKHQHHRAES